MLETVKNFLSTTGIARLFENTDWWQTAIMFVIAFVLVYLAIVKKFEPLLLLPIAIGMLLTNLPGAGMFHLDLFIPAQEAVDALNESLGYNDPFPVRLFNYLKDLVRLDFGNSYRTNQPVFDEIMVRFPVTLKLAVGTMILTILIGIPLGVLAAVRQYSKLDMISTFTALLLAAAPSFWLALLMMLLFSLHLNWLPPSGIDSYKNYIMPVMTQAVVYAASTLRMTRSTMLEAIRQDYVRTARGKGASESRVIWGHAIKNAMLPVITSLGMSFGSMLGGTIVIEQVFGMAGLGSLVITAITTKDIPQTMAVTIFLAALFCVIMLVVDLLYAFIDPRVKARYTQGGKH